MTAPDVASRPQQQRSRITQQRLLDATVACLVTYGWSGTTTTLIADTAGVSRGAQLHHFPTKTALVLAAVEYLTERRAHEIANETRHEAHNDDRVERVVDLLGSSFTGPLFQAALEVWVAARTDGALRRALVPLEAKIGRQLFDLTATLLDVQAEATQPDVRDAIQATLELLRGLGIANLLGTDTGRSRAILRSWTRHLTQVINASRAAA